MLSAPRRERKIEKLGGACQLMKSPASEKAAQAAQAAAAAAARKPPNPEKAAKVEKAGQG